MLRRCPRRTRRAAGPFTLSAAPLPSPACPQHATLPAAAAKSPARQLQALLPPSTVYLSTPTSQQSSSRGTSHAIVITQDMAPRAASAAVDPSVARALEGPASPPPAAASVTFPLLRASAAEDRDGGGESAAAGDGRWVADAVEVPLRPGTDPQGKDAGMQTLLHVLQNPPHGEQAGVTDAADSFALRGVWGEEPAGEARTGARGGSVLPALVFVNTAATATRVERWLRDCSVRAAGVHKQVPAAERSANLGAFATGAVDVLVCTDLGARGIDLPRVRHVVQFEMAEEASKTLHRMGRTARAGAQGVGGCAGRVGGGGWMRLTGCVVRAVTTLARAKDELLLRRLMQAEAAGEDLNAVYSRGRRLRKQERKATETADGADRKEQRRQGVERALDELVGAARRGESSLLLD